MADNVMLTQEQTETKLEELERRLKALEQKMDRYDANGLNVLQNQNLIGTASRQAKAGNL